MSAAIADHWAFQYLALPWVNGSRDCFQFFRQVQADHFKRDVPPYFVDAGKMRECMRAVEANPERNRWELVQSPKEGDAVLMSLGKVPSHVGVWVDVNGGGILHCVQSSGVIFSQVKHLANMGFKITGFYRFGG